MPSVPAAGVLLTVPVSGSKINPLGRPDTLRVGTGQPVDETLKLPEPPTLKVAVDKVLSEGVSEAKAKTKKELAEANPLLASLMGKSKAKKK